MAKARTVEERFWSKVDKSGDCWLWTGATRTSGHGKFTFNGRDAYAHRVSYELSGGRLSADTSVNRTCRTLLCVRPSHLVAAEGRMSVLKTTCKRGHDLTSEGARSNDGGCRLCRRIRAQEKAAEVRAESPTNHRSELPEEVLAHLLSLHALSSKTRGHTPLDHEYRKAGDLLAALSVEAMAEYGVDATALSRQMGLSRNTIRYFLMRRGDLEMWPGYAKLFDVYGNASPRKRAKTCRRGHDTTSPGARYGNGTGNCRKCKQDDYHNSIGQGAWVRAC